MCRNPQQQSFLRLGGRHTECACYFLNGPGFSSQTQANLLSAIQVRLRLTVKRFYRGTSLMSVSAGLWPVVPPAVSEK